MIECVYCHGKLEEISLGTVTLNICHQCEKEWIKKKDLKQIYNRAPSESEIKLHEEPSSQPSLPKSSQSAPKIDRTDESTPFKKIRQLLELWRKENKKDFKQFEALLKKLKPEDNSIQPKTDSSAPAQNQIEVKKFYYSTGHLFAEIPYHQGKIHGLLKRFYEDGQLSLESSYTDGKKQGPSKIYSKSGDVVTEKFFNQNKSYLVRHYWPSGLPKSEKIFSAGKVIKKTQWLENGKPQVAALNTDKSNKRIA